MTSTNDFRKKLKEIFEIVEFLNYKRVTIRAGDLHAFVNKNISNYHPACCNAMYEVVDTNNDKILALPMNRPITNINKIMSDKPQGPNLKICYKIPRP